MRKVVWPAGEPDKAVTDDRPLRQFVHQLVWGLTGRKICTMTMDRATHAMRPEIVAGMAAEIQQPRATSAYVYDDELAAVAALEAINA